jgi:uncharacterized protein YjdB
VVSVVPEPIPVTGVELVDEQPILAPGSSLPLVATVLPEDASNKNLFWESDKEDIATVGPDGVVTALKPGTVSITVTTVQGQYKAKITIIVKVTVTGVALEEKGKLILEVGDEEELVANILPEDATNPKVSWESSEPTVATVDNNGKLKAAGVGKTIITVTTEEGEFSDTREVEVVETALDGIKLNQSDIARDVVYEQVNSDISLSVTYQPANATDKRLTWKSSDETVAVVNENGKVSIVSPGTATITVTSVEGSYTDNLNITVGEFYSFLNRSKWSIFGYVPARDDGDGTSGPGWSSQASGEGYPNGRITAILRDDDAFWHSSWGGFQPPYPHWFIVDLGEEVDFDAVMLRRRIGNNGTANGYTVRTATTISSGFDWVEQGNYSFDRNTDNKQSSLMKNGTVTARYIMIYMGKEFENGTFAMFSQFGLHIKKE